MVEDQIGFERNATFTTFSLRPTDLSTIGSNLEVTKSLASPPVGNV